MRFPKIFQRQAPKLEPQVPDAPKPEPVRIFYSAEQGGFFHSNIHGENLPKDARPITPQQHQACLLAQERGEEIVPDARGMPVTRARVLDESLNARRRALGALRSSDWLVIRHAEECELGGTPSLLDPEYRELLEYRAALRAWPDRPDFPAGEPPRPSFLK